MRWVWLVDGSRVPNIARFEAPILRPLKNTECPQSFFFATVYETESFTLKQFVRTYDFITVVWSYFILIEIVPSTT